MGEVPDEFGKHDAKLVRELCRAIFERAARYVCANISAILVYTGKGRDEVRIAYVNQVEKLQRAIEVLGLGIQAYNAKQKQ